MDIKRLSTVAERQHGLVAIYQADLLGMSRRTWYRLIEGGVLVPVHQGVAAFVGSPPTAERAVMAAVLAAGPRSVAGARSAAWLWDCFDPPAGTPVDVMLRGRPAARTLDGVVAHRPVDHLQLLAVEQRGIPVTPPSRTLLDLGAVAPWAVRPATERMVVAGLVTRDQLEAAVRRHSRQGRAGIGPLRAVLADWTLGDRPPDSVLEARLLRILSEAGLPEPEVQVQIGPYLIDVGWPPYRVGGEVDGWAKYHSLDQFERQAARDTFFDLQGWTVPHFTWRMVTRFPRRVTATLERLLRSRGWR